MFKPSERIEFDDFLHAKKLKEQGWNDFRIGRAEFSVGFIEVEFPERNTSIFTVEFLITTIVLVMAGVTLSALTVCGKRRRKEHIKGNV